VTLWDFETWSASSSRHVDLARDVGALAMLSIALNGQGMIAVWRGDLEVAAALVAEDDAIEQATGPQIAPYGAMLLAACQGRVAEASTLITATIEDSNVRGEGLGVDVAGWASAILNNSAGHYPRSPGHGGTCRCPHPRALHLDMDAAGAHRGRRQMRATRSGRRGAEGVSGHRASR
jgi:hypothetical protein